MKRLGVIAPGLAWLIFFAPAVASAEGNDGDAARRISDIQERLEWSERSARLWYFGWASLYAAGFTARVALALCSDSEGIRIDSQVSAVTLGAGLIGTLVLMPPAVFAAGRMRGEPARTPEERRQKVLLGQGLLEASAASERQGKSFLPHLVGALVNVSAGLYLWLGRDRPLSAVAQSLGGIAVSELKIGTQPTTATEAMDPSRRELATPTASVVVTPFPMGVSVVGRF
ncbi:MAG: hypothetical protein ABI895_16910 [Deltaproteobacteria bacterium]